jgi:hypothetical protein
MAGGGARTQCCDEAGRALQLAAAARPATRYSSLLWRAGNALQLAAAARAVVCCSSLLQRWLAALQLAMLLQRR